MADTMKRLPDAELEIMLLIWQETEPVSASTILEKLGEQRSWALATLMTVLGRLVEKGFLTREKRGRNNFYSPLIAEADYKASEGKTMLEKLYGNSFENLVASLYSGKSIDAEDISSLRSFLDALEKEEA